MLMLTLYCKYVILNKVVIFYLGFGVTMFIKNKSTNLRKFSQNFRQQYVNKENEKDLFVHPLRPEWMYKTPNEVTLIFLDLETTGGGPLNSDVTEIALIKYQKMREVDRFTTLINPKRVIPNRIIEMTKITNQMVINAPIIEEIIEKIIDFIGDSVVIAHGVQSDIGFIVNYAKQILNYKFDNFYICTHTLLNHFFSDMPSKSLGGACKYFDIKMKQSHRALTDAEATAKLFWKIYDQLNANGITIMEDIIKYQADNFTLIKLGVGLLLNNIEEKVPNLTGIYYLHNSEREINYLSASNNLRQTVIKDLRLSEDKEFNKLLVDARDIKFNRYPHFLEALLAEKTLLKKLNLPIDPRKIQKRNDNFIQIFIPKDIIVFAKKYPTSIPFSIPSQNLLEETYIIANENNIINNDELKIRKKHRLCMLKISTKHQVNRNNNNNIINVGNLQTGIGWYFGPFSDPKIIEKNLADLIIKLEITDKKISEQIRAYRLWTFILSLFGEELKTEQINIKNKFFALVTSVKKVIGIKHKKEEVSRNLSFNKHFLPKNGLAVILNYDYKEYDIYIVIHGCIVNKIKLSTEDILKLSSSRFITRLFKPYEDKIFNNSIPVYFSHEYCADIETISYWINEHNGEGEWLDFIDIKDLYNFKE